VTEPRFDLVAVGSTVVDYIHRVTVLPQRDTGVMVLDRRSAPGGVESNVAAAAARLGLRVGVIVRVGADEPGGVIRDDFRQRGIDTARLQVGEAGDTAYTYVFVDGQGDRMMVTGGHGVRGLTLDAEDDAYIRQARVCFTSGYLPAPLLHRVARICAAGGPLLAFDLPGSFDDLEGRGLLRRDVDAALPAIALFLTNRDSLRSYTGEETIPAGLAALRRKGARRVSVSDGARGLVLFDASGEPAETHVVPGFATRVVDTTGAGDVLSAALIATWLLAGWPAARAGRFAAAAAALSCQDWGVRAALPTWSEAAALAGDPERDPSRYDRD
jgi:sugar/nucleoside kinase (ribokinase family)